MTLTAPVGRGRYNRWGATDAEVADAMPGDELVPHPVLGYTRAIKIDAPPERVWPWLVQIGQGRGGLYSFDGLENLAGCDIRSADQILPDFQQLGVGDLIRLGPAGYPSFRVDQVKPGAALVLVGADPRPPHPAASPDSPAGIATWQWQLRPTPDTRGTRLVTRQRLSYRPTTGLSVMWHLVEPIGFVMEGQMLRGIKQRAERNRSPKQGHPRPAGRRGDQSGRPARTGSAVTGKAPGRGASGRGLFVELKRPRSTDLLAMRRHEVVEHAVQVQRGALVEGKDRYVVPDWDDTKRAETRGWWRWTCCTSVPHGGAATWRAP